MNSYLGGNPIKFFFIMNLILLNFVCLRFSFNCLKVYYVIVLIFQDNEAEIRDGFFFKAFFSNIVCRKCYKGESTSIACSMKIMHTLSLFGGV